MKSIHDHIIGKKKLKTLHGIMTKWQNSQWRLPTVRSMTWNHNVYDATQNQIKVLETESKSAPSVHSINCPSFPIQQNCDDCKH